MKRTISLFAVIAIMCVMLIQPTVFAEVADKNAYQDIDVLSYGKDTTEDWWTAAENKVDGTLSSLLLSGGTYIIRRNVEFGNVAPKAITMNVDLDNSLYWTAVSVYAIPTGSTISKPTGGEIATITLPGSTETTDADSYLIVDGQLFCAQTGGSYYHKEIGATGFAEYQFKLNGANAANLVKTESTSNKWDIVICASNGSAYKPFSISEIRFDDSLDAFSIHNPLYNAVYDTAEFPQETGEGILKANDGDNVSMVFEDVDFGTEENRNLAAAISYVHNGKDGGSYKEGDIVIEVADDGGAYHEVGRITPVYSGTTVKSYTTHYSVLTENVKGVHDVRLTLTRDYMARIFLVKFADLGAELEEVYGEVAVTKGDTTTKVSLPINKSYIKGDSKYLVALYNVNSDGSKTFDSVTSKDVTVETKVDTIADKTDYGFDNGTLASLEFANDEITGKEIRAFLWTDMTNIIPLVPVTSTTAQ